MPCHAPNFVDSSARGRPLLPQPRYRTPRLAEHCLPRRALRARLRNVDAQRAAIDLEAIKVVHRRVGVVGVGEGHEAEATLPRRILALGELRAALDLSVLGEDLVEGGVVRAVVEVPDVHAAAVLILATAEVSARLLLAALRPRLRSEELHPHCPPIHVVAVKRVHSGLRARLLLEHHETETALEDGGREPCHGSVPAHLAHRVEAVRHMLGADDGAELAEDVGEVLVLRREVEVAHEELALLLRVQRPGRRREVVALRLGRAHEVVSDGLLRHRDADHGARSAAGGDRRRRHEGERRGIGGAEREGDHFQGRHGGRVDPGKQRPTTVRQAIAGWWSTDLETIHSQDHSRARAALSRGKDLFSGRGLPVVGARH
mmetsp:Transcript_86865/g.246097  ORF Transcript_86865/g.246097 Transcript_86865/m.246097 type:complete len:374 (+) Transcript_86865:700-1821(+)